MDKHDRIIDYFQDRVEIARFLKERSGDTHSVLQAMFDFIVALELCGENIIADKCKEMYTNIKEEITNG